MLHVRLLGNFSLSDGDHLLTGITTPRLQSLVAYLILHRAAAQSRQHIAYLFWPDATDAQARNNLRQMVHQLRVALPDADQVLHADVSTLHWRADHLGNLDVAEFESAIAQAQAAQNAHDDATARTALERAASSYGGDLLPSCYDEWIAPERARLCAMLGDGLAQLIQLLETQRDYAAALPHAQRLRDLDPLHEEHTACLMRLYTLDSNQAGAVQAYRDHETLLKRELGIEPSQALLAAYERLRRAEPTRTIPRSSEDRSIANLQPLIGRRIEWEQLQVAWRRSSVGQAQIALISGEAGIGKSRLAEELLIWVRQQGFATARTRAYAAEGRLSYSPVIECLRSDAVFQSLTRLDKVWLSEVARLLPELLTQHPDLIPPQPMTDYVQRQRFFEALARAMLNTRQPLLLVMDDLQWCDQDTLEWLRYLLHFDARGHLLVVGTARSEALDQHHPLTAMMLALRNDGQTIEIELSPLDAAETTQLAVAVAGKEIDAAQATRLFHETEGNPLFVVEMARADLGKRVEEQRGGEVIPAPLSPDVSAKLPPKVHAVIASRLAQLSPSARALAQLAATLGREFTLDVLVKASDSDEASVADGLDELWQRRILRDHGSAGYDFSHDKIRDVAYASLGSAQRRRLHRRAAQALEAANSAHLDPISAQLAVHYERAGLDDQAIAFYQRAADVAQDVYAYDEAIALLSKGLKLLDHIADRARYAKIELRLLLGLANAIRATKGWASPDLEPVLPRALALARQVGTKEQQTLVFSCLHTFHLVRAEFDKVQEWGNQLEATMPDDSLWDRGTVTVGLVLQTGFFQEAETNYQRAHLDWDTAQHQQHIAIHGVNFFILNAMRSSHALWFLGYPDRALARSRNALAMARQLNHAFSEATACAYHAMLHLFRRLEGDAMLTQAREGLDICVKQHVLYYGAWCDILFEWAQSRPIATSSHVNRIHQKIEDFLAAGARIRLPLYLYLLADAQDRSGQTEVGLATLGEALSLSAGNKDRFWDAELHRLRGELLLTKHADAQEIESAYRYALQIAQVQQAKSFELRAATSLARLWQTQAKWIEARDLLQPVYDWFTEGFDTPDLQEAYTLLEQLSKNIPN